ncbi:MAG: M20 family metallo-hydrolase [Flavobacteriaceae bacterium]|jgi:acetylornithine deacetylase|nr:M20 family metallo-hydrolase [Flavobacteriaceae bacterium]
MPEKRNELKQRAIKLIKELIKTPSFSGSEDQTSNLVFNFLKNNGIDNIQRKKNNIWAYHSHYQPDKKTVLLNSHHDTVKNSRLWNYDPFGAEEEEGKIIGLGANDAGASVVSLLATFLYFKDIYLPFNLVIAITAEEEISGKNNVASILPELGKIDLGIVGEPTRMDMAIAERGLIVLDYTVKGKSGHAARNEGVNAIYLALEDIEWYKNYQFPKVSELLGEVKITVTQIEAGRQHNVIPDECRLVVDIRVNELYSNEEVVQVVKQNIKHDVEARSYRLNSSRIDMKHPIVQRGMALGLKTYGSPTLSDQSMMNFDTVKIGPGDSARSHTPDEYIFISEIENGIDTYIKLLEDFKF